MKSNHDRFQKKQLSHENKQKSILNTNFPFGKYIFPRHPFIHTIQVVATLLVSQFIVFLLYQGFKADLCHAPGKSKS